MNQKKNLLTIGIVIVLLLSLNFNGFTQNVPVKKTQSIFANFGAGIE